MLYIGLMSGTSLDGIDAALVEINQDGQPNLVGQHYQPYSSELQSALFQLSQANLIPVANLTQLDQQLGRLYASCCTALLDKYQCTAAEIQAIGCHGQTIRHQPRPNAYSLQIGDANQLAEITGITTVADFRRRDIAAGGEGAPLVPAFHHHAFLDPAQSRQILNLGGIANVTVLSPDINKTFGFDLGPANALSDEWVEKHWQLKYDDNGAIARSGNVQKDLLESWLALEYFQQSPPKSTGRELFNLNKFEQLAPAITTHKKEDVLASLIELTALTIGHGITKWGYQVGELFLCGGGARNSFLIERLQHHLPNIVIKKTDEIGIPADMVEATAFAWLAYRTMNGMSGNLAATTGAKGPRILGAIYPGGI